MKEKKKNIYIYILGKKEQSMKIYKIMSIQTAKSKKSCFEENTKDVPKQSFNKEIMNSIIHFNRS